MTRLPEDLIERLHSFAMDIRETFDERGHHIDGALDHDPSFRRSKRGRSALTRELISSAFERSAPNAMLHCRPGPGGSLEVYEEIANGYAALRLRGARISGGEIIIRANSASAWGGIDEDALLREYPYVFAYIMNKDGSLEIFVAEVLDVEEGKPGRLILGNELILGRPTSAQSSGFLPDEDDSLPGFEDEDEDLGEESA